MIYLKIYENKKITILNLNFFVKIIIYYVVHHAYAKLKMKNMVNILIVMFVL